MTEPKPPKPAKPLFLAPQARQGDGSGYLNQPLRQVPSRTEANPLAYDRELIDQAERVGAATTMADEPECCSEDLADYAKTATFWKSQRHAAEVLAMREIRPLLRAEDRLRDAERRAKQARRRDLKGEFVALRGMLARFQRGGVEPPPGSSILNRLERVEVKLDGIDDLAA
jgi:hypothetical protein